MSLLNLDNKIVFVTGGTGTIGYQVVKELLVRGAFVIVYSRDQNKQFQMAYDISSKRVTYKNGDVCDFDLLRRSMDGADYVIHCAASKHVPLCEQNADSAIKVNVNGTRNVLQACVENKIKGFILVSTDKAVDPTSVMGSTKLLAERLTLEFSSILCASVVRLGNVFASNGSVVPTFADRIKNKLDLIVTDKRADRFFITKKDASSFIVNCLCMAKSGRIFIKKMKQLNIYQLAECMGGVGYPITVTSLTQGEKITEKLYSSDESPRINHHDDYLEVGDEPKVPYIEGCDFGFYTDQEIMDMLKEIK
jgi:FlaA1/EpsC-like NDP-sugar epimerase